MLQPKKQEEKEDKEKRRKPSGERTKRGKDNRPSKKK